MPRIARFIMDNSIYHVMVRGNNKNAIFHEEKDYKYYLKLLNKVKEKYEIEIYHYVLMNNHVHIIMKVKKGKELGKVMKSLNLGYTQYYRKQYGGIGHFFQDRYKSFIIQEGKYLLECGKYVELNPVKAGIAKKPTGYKWSSYKNYISGKIDEFIDIDPEYISLSKNKDKRKIIYKDYVESNDEEQRDEKRFFNVGAYGSKQYIKNLMKKGLKPRWSHRGRPKVNV
ncbi:MAG: transposase [Elusimicrobiota bacterium]